MTSTNRKRLGARVVSNVSGQTRTKKAFKAECDVNNIMANYRRSGVLPTPRRGDPRYGDFTQVPGSYHEAMNQILESQKAFMALPSAVRAEFENDPGNFLDAVAAAENGDEQAKELLQDLGLLTAKAPEAPEVPAGTPPGPGGEPETPARPAEAPATKPASKGP